MRAPFCSLDQPPVGVAQPAAENVPPEPPLYGSATAGTDRVRSSGARFRLLLALVIGVGLALRIAAAQGGLWLDEAWSAAMARDVGTPLGVMLGINHDNNHHLNSLWLQLIGFGASPTLARAPSIIAGTISIGVAAVIGLRQGRAAAVLAAAAFALSPAMVTIGSEARGYGTMLLALLVAVLLVERSLAERDMRSRATGIMLCFLIGMLSQLTMAFAICALLGWAFVASWQREGLMAATRTTLRLLGPGLTAAAAVAALVLGAAATSTGFRFGDYQPFAAIDFTAGLGAMLGYTVGIPASGGAPALLMLGTLALAWRLRSERLPLYALALLGFPTTVVALQLANIGHPRYYLLVAIVWLLALADVASRMMVRGGWRRLVAAMAAFVFGVGSLVHDAELIGNLRGDPAAAVEALRMRQPEGAALAIAGELSRPALEAAAAHVRYPLSISTSPCPAPRFLFVERFRGRTFDLDVRQCGRAYRPILRRRALGLSGTDWTLYERAP